MKKFTLILIFAFCLLPFALFTQSITWQRIYDSPAHLNDVAYDICQSTDGYFFAAGAGGGPGNGLYVLKLNDYGDTLWTRIVLGPNAFAVSPSSDGGCVVTGTGAFTIKFGSSGNLVWQISYSTETIDCNDIMRSADGNFLICGGDRSQFVTRGYLLKVDSTGNLIWQRSYPSADDRFFHSIVEAIDGGYILAGGHWFSDTIKANLVKTDTSGNIIWERNFRINNAQFSVFAEISKLNNNYIIGGKSSPSAFSGSSSFVRTDINGNILFTKVFTEYYQYPGSNFLDMKVAQPNRFIFTFAAYNTIAEDSTCHVVVTDSLGNTLIQKFFIYGRFPSFEAILPLNNGDIVFAGSARPPVFGWYDVYLARTDSLLNAPPIGIIPIGNEIPSAFALYQNYPNPFNSKSKIKYQISKSESVRLSVYDVLGREIYVLVNEKHQPGTYEILWDAENFSSGVYFLTLYISSNVIVRKMILIK